MHFGVGGWFAFLKIGLAFSDGVDVDGISVGDIGGLQIVVGVGEWV